MSTHTIVHIIIHLICLLLYTVNVETVPPDYCLHPLNTSNCNQKPKPVFYYYLSGSRCDIGYWRGCPTLNMFDNEFDCSDRCVFHFGRRKEPAVEEPPSENNLFDELMKLPEENLTVIEGIIKDFEVNISIPLMETEETIFTTDLPTTTAEVETVHEEKQSEEVTPAGKDSESGLPEEVEVP